jgi:hypothetical protein
MFDFAFALMIPGVGGELLFELVIASFVCMFLMVVGGGLVRSLFW